VAIKSQPKSQGETTAKERRGAEIFTFDKEKNFWNIFFLFVIASVHFLTMEHIRTAKVENVKLLDKITPKSSPIGTLYLTTSHLIFIDEKEKKELWW
jgi:hypothetical protein